MRGKGESGVVWEKMVMVDNRRVLVFVEMIKVDGSKVKDVWGWLGVGRGNDRGMKIEEGFVMEELMNGNRDIVRDREERRKSIGRGREMRDVRKKVDGII